MALADGRIADARTLIREAVDLGQQLGDRVGLSWYLSQFSLALSVEGRTAEAGRIWGTVEAATAFVPGGPWPRDIEALDARVIELADADFEQARIATDHSLEEMATWVCALD